MNGKQRRQRDSLTGARNSSAKKPPRDSLHSSLAGSQKRSVGPSTSHLQELTKSDYRKKVMFLNRYIDDLDRFNVLDRTLQPQSPVYSCWQGSDKRKVALETENSYFVQKINELQVQLAAKNRKILELETTNRLAQSERHDSEQERVSLRKMIELLNRENNVLKKVLKILPDEQSSHHTQSTTAALKENTCCNRQPPAKKEASRVCNRHAQTAE